MKKLKLRLYRLLSFIPYFKRKFVDMSFQQIESLVIKNLNGYVVHPNITTNDTLSKIFAITFKVALKSENIELEIRVDYSRSKGINIQFTYPRYSAYGTSLEVDNINGALYKIESQLEGIFVSM